MRIGSLIVRLEHRQRRRCTYHRALAENALNAEGAAENFHPLAHSREPEMTAVHGAAGIEALSPIGDFDYNVAILAGDDDALVSAAAVAKAVRQRFLQQAKQGEL